MKIRGNAFIAHGGGPTCVLNASLLGVVETARHAGIGRLWAPRGGLGGFLAGNLIDLLGVPQSRIESMSHLPASMLGTYRGPFDDNHVQQLVEYFRRSEIRYFLYTGGNGSMGTALRVARAARAAGYELNTIGIPKTIDNDIRGTDHTPGFGSAARFIAMALRDMAIDQRSLPTPVSIAEVMGRNSGFLAAASILARNGPDDRDNAPHFVYVPEKLFDEEEFLGRVDNLLRKRGWVIGVVAESLRNPQGVVISEAAGASMDSRGRPLASNVSAYLANLTSQRLKVRSRSEKPGLLCRASSSHVSPVDWAESREAGQFAVRAALRGEDAVMVAFRRDEGKRYRCRCVLVPLERVAEYERTLPMRFVSGIAGIHGSYWDYAAPLIGPALPAWLEL